MNINKEIDKIPCPCDKISSTIRTLCSFELVLLTHLLHTMERPPAAPEKPIPQQSFYSIEYPGYVKHASVPIAVNALGGQSKIDQAFKRVAGKTQPMLELSLRPGNPFAHPIMGEVSNSNNLVLKVVMRKRKKKNPDDPDVGEYTASIAGVMAKTVRFRGTDRFQKIMWTSSDTLFSSYGRLSVPP